MPWIYPSFCWATEAEGRAAIAAQGWAEGKPPGVDLLIIGTWYLPQEPVAEGEEQPAPVAIPGWWLACAFRDRVPPAEWSAARVVLPAGMPRLGADDLIASYQVAIDALVQATARSRGYTDAATCAGYALDPNPIWQAEGEAFIAWRSGAYQQAFATLAEVHAGIKPAPSVEAFVASLPAMTWPA